MCYPRSGYIMFSLTNLKFYEGRGPDMRNGGWGPNNPNTRFSMGNSWKSSGFAVNEPPTREQCAYQRVRNGGFFWKILQMY